MLPRRVDARAILAALAAAGIASVPCFGLSAERPASPPAVTARRAPALRPVRVHTGGRFLETDDGRPFFWLGDTAWQLIHATTREECSYYLHTRARQGYTVVQAVVLSEFDGLNKPSALGERPFADNDPTRPNEAYFDRVVEIVAEAESLGVYVALVPAWGDKLTAPWGDGPRVFRNDNLSVAREYARHLAHRLRGRGNVVWILGGDRPPRVAGASEWVRDTARNAGFPPDQDWTPIWRQMAAGLAEGTATTPLILYHPQGGIESSSVFLEGEPWLSVNGMQSGHGGGHDQPVWDWIARDYALLPARPTLDLEPNYEDHPFNPWPRWDPSTGYFRDHDVRKQCYRSVFAGGCGVTYGHHAVWGFVGARNDVINQADRDWIDALQRPGGRQMPFLRGLVESRPYFDRIPDQALVAGDAGAGPLHIQATRDAAGTYAFVYFPMPDQTASIDLSRLRSPRVRAWWFDPRTGVATLAGEVEGGGARSFRTPPYGPDWVLVLDDPARGYAPPGLERFGR